MNLCLLVMRTSSSFPNFVMLLFLQSFLFQNVICIQSCNIGAFLFNFLILALPLLFTDAFRCSNICRDIQTFSMLLELILCYVSARKVQKS
jgi:hypothetical protein